MTPADLYALQTAMPSWNSREYARRLAYQDRDLAVQLVAWAGDVPVGRGMLIRPGHPEWSISAWRESCPEVRDVEVREGWRRRGAGEALLAALDDEARAAGLERIGLMVGLDAGYSAARAMYERRGFRRGHGPFVVSTWLEADDGSRVAVGGVCVYLVKELGADQVS